MNEADNGESDGEKTKRQHQQQKPTKFQLFEISPPLTPATASMKSHYCVYEPCATSPSLSLSLSLTHNVVTLYKIQLCLNILFWLTENYIVLPVSLTVYQPRLYVYPLFQDLFSLPFFHDRNVSNGWVILSGAGCLSGVLLYISMTRPSLPAARHSYEFQPHSHILQTRAKHRWVAAEERDADRESETVREQRVAAFITILKGLFYTIYTHRQTLFFTYSFTDKDRQHLKRIMWMRGKWQAIKTFNGPFLNTSQEFGSVLNPSELPI